MSFYRVKNRHTGRIEIVEANSRPAARNAIASDTFEVELATAEDGFALAKEGRAIIKAETVADPDQPTLPLGPSLSFPAPGGGAVVVAAADLKVVAVAEPDRYLAGIQARAEEAGQEGAAAFDFDAGPGTTGGTLESGQPQGYTPTPAPEPAPAPEKPKKSERIGSEVWARIAALEKIGFKVPSAVAKEWDKVTADTVDAFVKDVAGKVGAPTPYVLADYRFPKPADPEGEKPEAGEGDDRWLVVKALELLDVSVNERIVAGWSEEERLEAWGWAQAAALAGEVLPEIPAFLAIYRKAPAGAGEA